MMLPGCNHPSIFYRLFHLHSGSQGLLELLPVVVVRGRILVVTFHKKYKHSFGQPGGILALLGEILLKLSIFVDYLKC